MAALFPVPSSSFLKDPCGDFPGGPVVKNPPVNAADAGLIPGQGAQTPQALGRLSRWAALQLESQQTAVRVPHAAAETGRSQMNKL